MKSKMCLLWPIIYLVGHVGQPVLSSHVMLRIAINMWLNVCLQQSAVELAYKEHAVWWKQLSLCTGVRWIMYCRSKYQIIISYQHHVLITPSGRVFKWIRYSSFPKKNVTFPQHHISATISVSSMTFIAVKWPMLFSHPLLISYKRGWPGRFFESRPQGSQWLFRLRPRHALTWTGIVRKTCLLLH